MPHARALAPLFSNVPWAGRAPSPPNKPSPKSAAPTPPPSASTSVTNSKPSAAAATITSRPTTTPSFSPAASPKNPPPAGLFCRPERKSARRPRGVLDTVIVLRTAAILPTPQLSSRAQRGICCLRSAAHAAHPKIDAVVVPSFLLDSARNKPFVGAAPAFEGAAEVSPARKGRETKMPSFHSFRAVFSREPFAGTITIFPSPRFSSGPASAVPKRKCLRPFPLARFSRASLRHVQAPRVRHPPLASESCPLASTAPP